MSDARAVVEDLRARRLFFLDRDGTVIIEDRVLGGAREFLDHLRRSGRIYYLLTNNSSRTPGEHHRRLRCLGLEVDPGNVLVSTQAAVAHLRARGIDRVYWMANRRVSAYLEECGLTFTAEEPGALLLTYDDELTYGKLREMCRLVREDHPYFATHPDLVCPAREGGIPDIGTYIEVIRLTTGRTPDRIFGKPHAQIITPVLAELGLGEGDAVIVGDRLTTDISLARGTGLLSVLVLSGDTDRAEYGESDVRDDLVVEDLSELLELMGG